MSTLKTIPREQGLKWVAALRDPVNAQITGKLVARNEDFSYSRGEGVITGYCCLGVYACKVAGAHIDSDSERDDDLLLDPRFGSSQVNDSSLLEQSWADTQGITKPMQELLSSLNDGNVIVVGPSPLGHAIPDGTPMGELVKAICPDYTVSSGGSVRCVPRKHSFAEIADIIEANFIMES